MSDHDQMPNQQPTPKPVQKPDPWANLADSLGAKPVAKPAAPPAAAPVPKPAPQSAPQAAASVPPAAVRPPQKPREERPPTAGRSDWGNVASTLGLSPAVEPTTPASSDRSQPPRTPVPSAPIARDAGAPPAGRRDVDSDEFSFGSRRPPAASSQQPSRDREQGRDREPGDSDRRREPPRPPRTQEPPRTQGTPRPETPQADRPDASGRTRFAEERPLSDTGLPSDGGPTDSAAAPRAPSDDEQGEGRGRRRRGRRGGRGRSGGGRRDDVRDRPLPARLDDEPAADRWPSAADHDGFDDRLDGEPGGPSDKPREAVDGDIGGQARGPDGDGGTDSEAAPRRRRRRGRRGGRRRGRGEREGDLDPRPRADTEGGEQPLDRSEGGAGSSGVRNADADRELDDEPLPAGYRARPPARSADSSRRERSRPAADAAPTGTGESAEAAKNGDRDGGETGGRRRRRRRRGEGRTGEGRGTAGPADSSGAGSVAPRRSADGSGQRRGRRSRRSDIDDRRSTSASASTFDRGRRDEFAPVAGGREEDDEGLEFLGIEDAGRDGHVRDERHPAESDDDSIIESGLNEVLDVPSWVEAIGIVIAGNLDARSRSPRGGDGDRGRGEPRGDSPPRTGSSERPRDSRRNGRSGDQR